MSPDRSAQTKMAFYISKSIVVNFVQSIMVRRNGGSSICVRTCRTTKHEGTTCEGVSKNPRDKKGSFAVTILRYC